MYSDDTSSVFYRQQLVKRHRAFIRLWTTATELSMIVDVPVSHLDLLQSVVRAAA